MCYYVDAKFTKAEVKRSFNLVPKMKDYQGEVFTNGFSHPKLMIITDEFQDEIILGDWGLIPFWSKDRNIQKSTLNAKIETLDEKPSFKNSIENRCLILVKGFYEWKWLDAKGKEKEKNYITLANEEIFTLGGIYNVWKDKTTGEELTTFSIVTTEANELMSEIHNTKHRMPIVLNEDIRMEWLKKRNIENFAFPHYNPVLISTVLK